MERLFAALGNLVCFIFKVDVISSISFEAWRAEQGLGCARVHFPAGEKREKDENFYESPTQLTARTNAIQNTILSARYFYTRYFDTAA